jgi:hypothetical protein
MTIYAEDASGNYIGGQHAGTVLELASSQVYTVSLAEKGVMLDVSGPSLD